VKYTIKQRCTWI